jgi:uncharacterized membrane protein
MECCICLHNTGFNDCYIKPRTCNDVRLKCMHIFHRNCIKAWFVQNDSCPVCRRELMFQEGSYFKYMMLLYEFHRSFGRPTHNYRCHAFIIDDVFIYYDNAIMILFVHNQKQNQLHFSNSTFQSKHLIGFKGLSHVF